MPVQNGTLGTNPQRLRLAARDETLWAGVDAAGTQLDAPVGQYRPVENDSVGVRALASWTLVGCRWSSRVPSAQIGFVSVVIERGDHVSRRRRVGRVTRQVGRVWGFLFLVGKITGNPNIITQIFLSPCKI